MLLLLLIGILPALLVGLVGQHQAAGALDQRARADLSNLAASVVDKLDRTLFERSGDVRLFADVIRNGPLFTGSVGSFMDTALAAYAPMYRLIVMADPGGHISAVSSVDQHGQTINSPALLEHDVRGQPWYQAWATGPTADAAFVQDLHDDPLLAAVYGDAGRTVTFSYPVHDINGQRAGVLALFFNWDVADTIIAEVLDQPRRDGGASINLTLVNSRNQVLSTSETQRAVGATLDLSAFTSGLGAVRGSGAGQPEAGAPQAVSADWQGLMASYAVSRGYGTYPGLGWAALASQAPHEALAALRTLQLQLGAFGALVALVVALVATRIGGGIARPLLALTGSTQRAAAGDLSQQVTVT
ncbi:MAG: cache domain-containing protein, partial [Chloroflexales bacterium]|nr:cache domain-containing protein [Chloroflexales bacterium]